MAQLAIYPGSFDPVTYGHLDVIKRAQSIFGKVIVTVANNASKKYLFSLEERVAMLKEATKGMKGIQVDSFQGLVTDYAKKKKTNVLIRGLRMTSDFEYEFQMALTNRRLAETVETVFLMPSERFSFLSATLLKEVARLDADISSFVPKCVREAVERPFTKMNIKIRSIPNSGLRFESSVMPREVGLFEDFINEEIPITVNGLFERVGNFVLAKVEVTCGIENHCARCLERISRVEAFQYDLEFEIRSGDEFIDVGERIREEMILAHIPWTLCREDCKGICPDCGAELNTEPCECKKNIKE